MTKNTLRLLPITSLVFEEICRGLNSSGGKRLASCTDPASSSATRGASVGMTRKTTRLILGLPPQ